MTIKNNDFGRHNTKKKHKVREYDLKNKFERLTKNVQRKGLSRKI